MRAYIRVTGIIFGLITVAHFARMIVEWPQFVISPVYWLLTLLAAGLAVWAWRLLRSGS